MRYHFVHGVLGALSLSLLAEASFAQTQPPELTAPPLPPPVTTQGASTAPAAGVPALADSLTGNAKVDYLAGRLLYEDGDAKSAQVKFQSAYDISKDPRLLWNVAACAKQQRRYAEVERVVQQYLLDGGTVLTEEDRVGAQALLAAIQPFLASAVIVVNEPEAAVLVDGEPIGKTPFTGTVRLSLGLHKLRFEKSGFEPNEQSVEVKGGVPITIDATLVPVKHEGALQVVAGTGERISVDSVSVGVGTWSGKLTSGSHNIEVMGDNKLPYRTSVVIVDNQTNSVRAVLEAKPEEKSAIPSWVWWVGGAVLAAGGGVGGYFLLKPEDKDPTSPAGSMEPTTVWLHVR